MNLAALLVDERLHLHNLAARSRRRRRHQIGQQPDRVLRRLGALGRERVSSPRRKSEQLRLLGAELRQALDDVLRVVAVSARGAHRRQLEQTLTDRSILERCLRRLLRRVADRNHPLAGKAARLCRFGSRRDLGVGQSVEIRLLVDDQRADFRPCEQLVGEIGAELGELLVERAHADLVGLGQLRARAHEVTVVPLDERLLLGGQRACLAPVVHRSHALIELIVQVNRVAVRGELRRDDILDLLEGVVGVGADNGEESFRRTIEQRAGAFHGHDRVVEAGWLHLLRDHIDLGQLLPHSLFESGLVVLVPNEIETRSVIRKRALDEQRIRAGGRRRRRSSWNMELGATADGQNCG